MSIHLFAREFTSVLSFRRWHLLSYVSLLLFCSLIPARAALTPSAPRSVNIAVVRDGQSFLFDSVDAAFRREAATLTAGRATLIFREGGVFDAGWREGESARALDAALADPSVDYVLALGVRIVTAAADPERKLSKPVIGALIQDTDLISLPLDAAGHSTKTNFAIVTLPSRSRDQLAELRSVVPFESLHVVADDFFAANHAALESWSQELAKRLSVPVTLIPFKGDVDETLAAIGNDARTIFLLPSPRLNDSDRSKLLQGFSARRLPTLTFLGQPDVEAGALIGVLPNPRGALGRRLAINLDQLLTGAKLSELPLRVTLPPQLYLNEDTARTIGFSPALDLVNRVTVVGRSAVVDGQPLNFTNALTLALEKNFALRAQQSSTEASRQGVKSAQGVVLPQMIATQSFDQIDRDRAAASGGAQPRNVTRAGVGVSQVLVDDEAFTRVRLAREALRQADYLEQAARLDTLQQAGQAYLQLLSAQASLRVAEENFQITQRNLELARLRLRVGTSGPEEGYRFESLEAQQRAELATARSTTDRARVALNRTLGVDAGSQWMATDVTFDDPAFSFTTARLITLVSDRQKLDRFHSFAASYAAKNSPDLAAFEQGVKSSRLTADQKKRRHYVPKVSASFTYSRTLDSEAGGPSLAEQFAAAGIPLRGTRADRDDWAVGVTASLPLFSGGTVTAEARRARAELRQAEFSRDDAREAVTSQAQATLFSAESAYANIAFSRRSSDLAGQNLAVVQDKYEQGAVSIVTLLDAQTAAFSQRLSAEAAVYKFFGELLSFQRSLGWIEAFATTGEKDAWLSEVEQAVTR